MTSDPQELLKTGDLRKRPFSEHVMQWCDDLAMWIADSDFLAWCNSGSAQIDEAVESIEATCIASCRGVGLDIPALVETYDASTAASFQTTGTGLTMDTAVRDFADVQASVSGNTTDQAFRSCSRTCTSLFLVNETAPQ